jgi:hypothetical protein
MAGTCPPHHWDINMLATDDVYLAHCKKCGAKRTYPACIEWELQKMTRVSISGSKVISREPVKRSKRNRPGRPPKWE